MSTNVVNLIENAVPISKARAQLRSLGVTPFMAAAAVAERCRVHIGTYQGLPWLLIYGTTSDDESAPAGCAVMNDDWPDDTKAAAAVHACCITLLVRNGAERSAVHDAADTLTRSLGYDPELVLQTVVVD